MQVLADTLLTPFHTLGIAAKAKKIVIAESLDDIAQLWGPSNQDAKLILGKGSNVFFAEDLDVTVVLNRLLGKAVTESDLHYHLHIGGGEDWPAFVAWTVENGFNGLENMALIPGCVGSAPIQNIGAYGLELKDVCEYVDAFNIGTQQVERLSAAQCRFGYRDSIFKHEYQHSHIIVAVGLRLAKQWTPLLNYGPLQSLADGEVTAQQIFERVCQVRMEKLPDPNVIGNAGSFFKNPLVTAELAQTLLLASPTMPHFPAANGEVKLAAGWLIDQCGLKGLTVGGARVHPQQALVLTNINSASAQDLIDLAQHVVDAVNAKFGVLLEHEVRFYNAQGETRLEALVDA
uniref:UDP-N-acetylmuramate dehydrogenase n=1 Tax=Thaumasiovibrio occultus TaxID=1891184 RepID=UPI000B355CAD|nr:UDP-N-acetylmuramate dehydrogenase [Thaumasiovibrio occultus]